METGIVGLLTKVVDGSESAKRQGSGTVDVFSTPSLVAFVEKTCWMSIDQFLEDGQTTVGTKMEIAHMAATPVGMEVSCQSKLIEIDRKRLVFEFEARDEKEVIAKGKHERFIIDSEKFLNRANAKCDK